MSIVMDSPRSFENVLTALRMPARLRPFGMFSNFLSCRSPPALLVGTSTSFHRLSFAMSVLLLALRVGLHVLKQVVVVGDRDLARAGAVALDAQHLNVVV